MGAQSGGRWPGTFGNRSQGVGGNSRYGEGTQDPGGWLCPPRARAAVAKRSEHPVPRPSPPRAARLLEKGRLLPAIQGTGWAGNVSAGSKNVPKGWGRVWHRSQLHTPPPSCEREEDPSPHWRREGSLRHGHGAHPGHGTDGDHGPEDGVTCAESLRGRGVRAGRGHGRPRDVPHTGDRRPGGRTAHGPALGLC